MLIQEENNGLIRTPIGEQKIPMQDAQMQDAQIPMQDAQMQDAQIPVQDAHDNVQDNEFCRLCDQFQQKYGKMSWVNIVYVALIICIMIFILSLLFSAPVYCWVLLLIFITIWVFRNRDINTGLFLLALFLFILLLSPSASETNPMIVLSTPK